MKQLKNNDFWRNPTVVGGKPIMACKYAGGRPCHSVSGIPHDTDLSKLKVLVDTDGDGAGEWQSYLDLMTRKNTIRKNGENR